MLELDKLKAVQRRSLLIDQTRYENTAERSWHLAMLVMVLAEWANDRIDLARALQMAVVHDIAEIDAGDTYAYAALGNSDVERTKAAKEEAAAERVFGLLPANQERELRQLWDEYEHGDSPTAAFVRSLDQFQPLLLNLASNGAGSKKRGITADQVRQRNRRIQAGSGQLWEFTAAMIDGAEASGLLDPAVRCRPTCCAS